MQHARAAGSVAEQDSDNATIASHLLCEGNAGRYADIAADHGMRAEKARFRVGHVAAPATSAIRPGNPAEQLGHHGARLGAARQCRSDRAPAAQQLVLVGQGRA